MIKVYMKPNCPACSQAKQLLNQKGEIFEEIPIKEHTAPFESGILVEDLKRQFPGARAAPVIVVDGQYIGGYPELRALYESAPQLLCE